MILFCILVGVWRASSSYNRLFSEALADWSFWDLFVSPGNWLWLNLVSRCSSSFVVLWLPYLLTGLHCQSNAKTQSAILWRGIFSSFVILYGFSQVAVSSDVVCSTQRWCCSLQDKNILVQTVLFYLHPNILLQAAIERITGRQLLIILSHILACEFWKSAEHRLATSLER